MDLTTQENIPQAQFREATLKKAFDEVSYSFEKILGEVRGDSKLVLAKQAVNQLQISLNQFENLLKERGFTVDSYDPIKYLYQEIEHPLSELRRYFMKEPSEILTDKAGLVYVNALKGSFRRLIDIAEEMENEHSFVRDRKGYEPLHDHLLLLPLKCDVRQTDSGHNYENNKITAEQVMPISSNGNS
jgi:hypothetical protein